MNSPGLHKEEKGEGWAVQSKSALKIRRKDRRTLW